MHPLAQSRAQQNPRALSSSHTQHRNNALSSGIRELDRVLGGGIVAGSVILVGGDPGIREIHPPPAGRLRHCTKHPAKALYVSGEESPEQIKIRAERLSIRSEEIILLPETLTRSHHSDSIKTCSKCDGHRFHPDRLY